MPQSHALLLLLLLCRHVSDRAARHRALNDCDLEAAGISATKEPSGLVHSDCKRPDGHTLMPWYSGKSPHVGCYMKPTYTRTVNAMQCKTTHCRRFIGSCTASLASNAAPCSNSYKLTPNFKVDISLGKARVVNHTYSVLNIGLLQ